MNEVAIYSQLSNSLATTALFGILWAFLLWVAGRSASVAIESGAGIVMKIAVAYTLWSLKKGAGKKIMKELLKYMKKQNNIDSIMTLSPLTPVATHYHIRNGAKLIKINPTTQNFQYRI